MPTEMIRAAAAPRLMLRAILPVEIAAAATEGEGDGEGEGAPMKRPTFSISGYTGAPMYVAGFYSPVILDLAGLKAASQEIPVLRDHDPSCIVGMTDSVKINAAGVKMTGIVTGENDHAEEVVTQARNGFKWQASVGAGIDRREFLDSGKTAQVNGRTVAGPIVIAREATIYEISFVAIGADGATSASVAASQPLGSPTGDHVMNFEAWLQAKGFDPAALSEQQKAALKASYVAEQKPAEATPAPAAGGADGSVLAAQRLSQIFAETQAEEDRVAKITDIAARYVRERPASVSTIKKLAEMAVEAKGTKPEEFELNLLRATRAGAPAVIGNGRDAKLGASVIEAAVCLAGNLDKAELEKAYDERALNAANDCFRRGLGLRDLIMVAARSNGYDSAIWDDDRTVLRAAFNKLDVRADGFSTLSLPNILANVANKFLMQGFNAVETGWRQIAKVRPVRDFKQISTNTLTGGFLFEKVGASGELKHATVGEKNYTNQADTCGRIFAITRKDIINDDLGALTEVPMRIGRGAALALNNSFWTTFLATRDTFWASGNSNLITGGGTVLSSAALTTATTKFRKQTDPDGYPLGITPKILLVPPELEITADELMTSSFINTGGSSSTDKVPNRNVWGGKYTVVTSTYLSNSAITNYSTTQWFLLADPMDLPTIEVVFLNGRDTPIVESADAEFDSLGIQMRGYFDYGVALQEFRASVRSAGA